MRALPLLAQDLGGAVQPSVELERFFIDRRGFDADAPFFANGFNFWDRDDAIDQIVQQTAGCFYRCIGFDKELLEFLVWYTWGKWRHTGRTSRLAFTIV